VKLPWRRARAEGEATGAAEPELSVLMVCMGNICRSPTAEGVLRQRLAKAGLADRVRVDSAGTHGYHVGDPPDPRAQQHARRRGVEIGAQRARQVEPSDFDRFQLILAMDQDNVANLARIRETGPANEPQLLMRFARAPGSPDGVPDPYYGGPEGFDRVLDLIEDACDGLIDHLRERLDRTVTKGTS
jgi:protein-tyrosine phosphatase